MNASNNKNVYILIGVVGVFVLVFGGYYSYNLVQQQGDMPPQGVTKRNSAQERKEAEVKKTIAAISKDNVMPTAEFYSDTFSDDFKNAYVLFRKGVATFGYGLDNDDSKKYLSQALVAFAQLYSNPKSSDEEKAFAIDVINAMYINSSWNDQLMIKTVYTVSPFKEMYEKNRASFDEKYPFLKNEKDRDNINKDQIALDGVASRYTMGDMNDMAYKLFPHGYAALRTRMNHAFAYNQIINLDPKNNNLSGQQKMKEYYGKVVTKKELLAFGEQLKELDKKDLLYLRTRNSSYEINLMTAASLYDPLIIVSDTKADKLKYHNLQREEYKKAADLAGILAVDPSRANLYVMVTLFYSAFLTDYGFVVKNTPYIEEKIKAGYRQDALAVAHSLMYEDRTRTAFINYLKRGKFQGERPAGIASTTEYYGGRPYYQLRVLAEQKEGADLKKFMIDNADWKF